MQHRIVEVEGLDLCIVFVVFFGASNPSQIGHVRLVGASFRFNG